MDKCPLCGEKFETPLKLANHLKKSDEKHQFLYSAIKILKKKSKEYQEVYDSNFQLFDNFISKYDAEGRLKEQIEQEKEKERQEKERLKQEKQAKLEAEKEERRKQKTAEALEKQKQKALEYQKMIEMRQFKNKQEKEFIQKLDSEYKPMNLAKYFYSFWDVYEFNFIIATACIKSLYFTYQLTPEQVKFLLRYTAETGHSKISDAKYLIEESQRFYQYAMELNQPSVPYLVKMFYNNLGLKIDKKRFVAQVDRIKTTMKDNNLSYNDAVMVIDNMIKKNVTSIYFFPDYIHDIIKNKPHYDIPTILSNIIQFKNKVSDYPQEVVDSFYSDMKDIILNGAFDESYNYSEFMYKIKLNPDKELIDFANYHDFERNSKFDALKKQYEGTLFEEKTYAMIESYVMWKFNHHF